MQGTYKFRLYPKKEDEKKLLSVLEICRLLYNSFLAIWNDSEKIPSRYKLQAMLPKMKEEKEGLKKKGRKVGKLRYKKYGQFKSFILNQSGFKVTKTGNRLDKLRISKIGVGLDMGIKSFLTDSDGRQIENPKFYKRTLERIRIEQRKRSRTKKGSKNRAKQIVRLAKLYQKLTNQRDDFLHKLSKLSLVRLINPFMLANCSLYLISYSFHAFFNAHFLLLPRVEISQCHFPFFHFFFSHEHGKRGIYGIGIR